MLLSVASALRLAGRLQPPRVSFVIDSEAVPLDVGFLTTLAANEDLLQVAAKEPIDRLTFWPLARLALSFAPFLTGAPVVLPTLSTGLFAAAWALAARAAPAGAPRSMTPAAATAARRYLRMNSTPSSVENT